MRFTLRPTISYYPLLRIGGCLQGIRHGLLSLRVRLRRRQLGVARRRMDFDQAFQVQRLSHRK